MKLTLEADEYIITRTGNIIWESDRGRKLEDFVLTNKGLYCCYKEKKGLFSGAEKKVYRFEIGDIVTDEEASHIEQVRVMSERCLQIEFKHGIEHFSFQRVSKETMDRFLKGFQEVLGVPDLNTIQKNRNREMFSNIAGDVVEGVGNLLNAGSRVLYEKIDQMTGMGASFFETDNAARYYLALDGKQQGPLGREEIRKLAKQGTIRRSTLVWTKGMETWRPLEEIPELRSAAEELPPEL